jgi:hypothetical protein
VYAELSAAAFLAVGVVEEEEEEEWKLGGGWKERCRVIAK